MKFEEQLLTNFRQHFVQDLDHPDKDFFSTYRFLDWERNDAAHKRNLNYQAQIYTLLGMLEQYRDKPQHSVKYFHLAHDIFQRNGNEEGMAFTRYKLDRLIAPA